MVRDDKREDRKTLEGRVIRERAFVRTIGIDYSGAATPTTRLNNLAVYCADGDAPPQLVHPPADALGRWTRREIAGWLVEHLQEQDIPTLVGIDHSFSFPIRYFREHNVPMGDWDHFLNDFRRYWPTDGDNALVSAIRDGTGRNRSGEPDWFRLTDGFSATAKSVFLFNVIGAVAHSTHAGIPWLRYIRQELRNADPRVHFWPFDGWDIPPGQSAIVEVYPSLWSRRFDRANRTPDQHDAYSVAGWLSNADRNGWLDQYFNPELSQEERDRAETEGWILGLLGFIRW